MIGHLLSIVCGIAIVFWAHWRLLRPLKKLRVQHKALYDNAVRAAKEMGHIIDIVTVHQDVLVAITALDDTPQTPHPPHNQIEKEIRP